MGGWLFIVSDRDPDTKARRHRLVRGYRIPEDLQVRVPVAAALTGKKVLVLGVGALGSFAATELARAGVASLTLIDSDAVEPGNSVRWPLGRPYWGLPKVWALAQFVMVNYPATTVHHEIWRVGAADAQKPVEGYFYADDADRLRQFILAADVVVDASASTECQQAVAYFCRKLGKPLVIGYATEGAAGGVVAKFPADSAACFICLHDHWKDDGFPLPAVDKAGTIVPLGCNQPTFTGGSFDLQEVSLEIVRSAVSLLAPNAYEPGAWQVAVLSHSDDGTRQLPRWRGTTLSPRCSDCAPV
ncbi:MAG: ThiF family adenylyltransferase [Caulobacter sp.]|nr:ThiF family adenylyltransferase [Caulobacter sp.]